MNGMETQKICPNCRKPLPPDVPLGLCPECLIRSGFPTEGGAGVSNEAAGARFVPPPVEEITPLFPQLEILGLIGKGGMGAVYKARQPALDRLVALKVLPPAVGSDPGFAERFTREARALARLNHPNIVAVHDFGKAGPLHYLIMEFVDGTNLREVERTGTLTPEQALAIVPQVCDALQFAHNEGIVHRDIKPENLLIDARGRVKITDFGIAKIVGLTPDRASLTGACDVVGTPHYMAPEQIEKPQAVDHRADIYSLGVVFYEMLTGELPLGKFQPPSKKVHLDVRLDQVVLHTLEKEPERRYQQVGEVKTDVESIAESPPTVPPAAARVPPQTGAVAPAANSQASASATSVTAPAVGLMIAAAWKFFSALVAVLFLAIPGGWASNWFGPAFDGFFSFRQWGLLAGVSVVLFKLVPAALILFGALQMLRLRSYAWAMAAGILAIVSCSLIGLPMGIWALVVLGRQPVKDAFATALTQQQGTTSQTGQPGATKRS
jgi:eukaryotic-like serine/threonine-protein kinase